jgi:sRNA-binding carbon storage regulator CsrA
MLVLLRTENQCVLMPALGIKITVLKCSKSKTTLGFEVPQDIRVLRGEKLEDFANRGKDVTDGNANAPNSPDSGSDHAAQAG